MDMGATISSQLFVKNNFHYNYECSDSVTAT